MFCSICFELRLAKHTSRSFELTREGRLFYERCTRIVSDLFAICANRQHLSLRIRAFLNFVAKNVTTFAPK
jgi:DNA-binding transcriptional LysR family regulator